MARKDEVGSGRDEPGGMEGGVGEGHLQEHPYAAPGERKEGLTTGMPGDLSDRDVADMAKPADQTASEATAATAAGGEREASSASQYTPPGECREGFEGA